MARLAGYGIASVLVAIAVAVAPVGVSSAVGSRLSASGGLGPVEATVVHGPCRGGGSIVLRVDKTAGSYVMTATTRGLQDGTRWRVGFDEGSNRGDAEHNGSARPVVRHGGWTVSRTVPALEVPYFIVTAFGPGRIDVVKSRLCSVYAQPSVPLSGAISCHKSLQMVMIAFQRDGVGTVVRWALFDARPDTRWAVTVEATTGSSGAGVSTEVTASHRGFLIGKDVFTGQPNPRLRLHVEAQGGQHCTLGMHRVLAQPAPASATRPKAHAAAPGERSALRALLSAQGHLVHSAG